MLCRHLEILRSCENTVCHITLHTPVCTCITECSVSCPCPHCITSLTTSRTKYLLLPFLLVHILHPWRRPRVFTFTLMNYCLYFSTSHLFLIYFTSIHSLFFCCCMFTHQSRNQELATALDSSNLTNSQLSTKLDLLVRVCVRACLGFGRSANNPSQPP